MNDSGLQRDHHRLSRRAAAAGALHAAQQAATLLEELCRAWSHGQHQGIGRDLLKLRVAVGRLRVLIRGMRAGSDPRETIDFAVRRQRIDLVTLAEREVSLLSAAAWRDRHISVLAMTDDGPVYATGDRRITGLVLQMLLEQQLASLDPGGLVLVRVRSRSGRAKIEIQDNQGSLTSACLARILAGEPLGGPTVEAREDQMELVRRLLECMGAELLARHVPNVSGCVILDFPALPLPAASRGHHPTGRRPRRRPGTPAGPGSAAPSPSGTRSQPPS